MPEDQTPEQPDGSTFIRITNQMVYAELQATRADLRALSKDIGDYPEVKKRVRNLELKFYGILAGVIAAFGSVVLSGRVG